MTLAAAAQVSGMGCPDLRRVRLRLACPESVGGQQEPLQANTFSCDSAPFHSSESPANGPELEYCQNDHVGAPAGKVPGALA